jgi:hypothetical protein
VLPDTQVVLLPVLDEVQPRTTRWLRPADHSPPLAVTLSSPRSLRAPPAA